MAQSICCKPNCNVCGSDPNLEWNEYSRKWEPKEQPKMTREKAELIVRTTLASNNAGFVTVLEKLGLLKFDEPKINVLFNYGKDAADTYDMHTPIAKAAKQYGTIRLEEWPEGLVLWVGGEIRWKSWLDKRPDEVNPV